MPSESNTTLARHSCPSEKLISAGPGPIGLWCPGRTTVDVDRHPLDGRRADGLLWLPHKAEGQSCLERNAPRIEPARTDATLAA